MEDSKNFWTFFPVESDFLNAECFFGVLTGGKNF